jgi:hypothetical protein
LVPKSDGPWFSDPLLLIPTAFDESPACGLALTPCHPARTGMNVTRRIFALAVLILRSDSLESTSAYWLGISGIGCFEGNPGAQFFGYPAAHAPPKVANSNTY